MWSFLLLFCREEKRCFTSTVWLKVVSVFLEKPIISIYLSIYIYIYMYALHIVLSQKKQKVLVVTEGWFME